MKRTELLTKKADSTEDLAELGRRDLARRDDRIEHRDGRRERVGDLLDGVAPASWRW